MKMAKMLMSLSVLCLCLGVLVPGVAQATEPPEEETSCVYFLQPFGVPTLTGYVEATPVNEGCSPPPRRPRRTRWR